MKVKLHYKVSNRVCSFETSAVKRERLMAKRFRVKTAPSYGRTNNVRLRLTRQFQEWSYTAVGKIVSSWTFGKNSSSNKSLT